MVHTVPYCPTSGFPLNLVSLAFHSRGFLWYHGYHARKAAKNRVWNRMLMLHSQILATWNSSTNHDIVPWIGDELHIGAEFQEFSRKDKYFRVPGKLPKTNSKVLMFPNPGDKVLRFVKTRGEICPVLKQEIGYCPLDWRTPGLWNGFLTVFQEPWHTCCSWKIVGTPLRCVVFPRIQGTMSWLVLKFHVTRIWELDV